MNKLLLLTLAALALLTGCGERKAEQAPAATPNEPVMVPSNEPEPGPVVMEFDKTQLRREITIAVLSIQSIRDAWELVEAMTQGGKRKSKHLVEMMDALPDFSKGDLSGSGSDCSLTEIRRLIESGQTRGVGQVAQPTPLHGLAAQGLRHPRRTQWLGEGRRRHLRL